MINLVFRSLDKWRIQQIILFSLGFGALGYATIVLLYASSSHEIGLKSILALDIIGEPEFQNKSNLDISPKSGDKIVKVGDVEVQTWAELLKAPNDLMTRIHEGSLDKQYFQVDSDSDVILVSVEFKQDKSGMTGHTWTELRRFPLYAMIPSLIWLFLKGTLFVIGAIVYWNRPKDETSIRFYILCLVTLCAYMGGYHWTQIVTNPTLAIIFMISGMLLPVVSLHFYLVFPHPKPWLVQYPKRMLAAIYVIPLLNMLSMIVYYLYLTEYAEHDSPLRNYLPFTIYASFGIAAVWYLFCMATLWYSRRTFKDEMELKQIRSIGIGVFFSAIPIALSLYIVLFHPDKFVEGAVTWPMFGASVIVTLAFAFGMTRYRLMELDKIITSGVGYFLVSFFAGLLYYGVVFVGALFYSRFVNTPTLPAALTVSTTALLVVFGLDMARSRIQKVLDRRFSHSKLQLDQTLQQMSEAISQLVDPPALAQRLLTTVADTLGIASGAIYLRQERSLQPVAALNATLTLDTLPDDAPLVDAMKNGLGLAVSESAEGGQSAAQKQLRALGGAVAQPLLSDGALLAILILGPKNTPYRTADWNLLAAFAQITVVALESAANHRAIEHLNQDLKSKVDKIAEQQRRILTLQTQLHRKATIEPGETESHPKSDVANPSGIVGSSPVLRQLLSLVRKVAATDAVVLLRGESGTGKELLARGVHESSPRAGKPYVKVHCAALSANLLESELFGHVKGAFTGAHKDKIGRFEMADGGTLFLDEIGDISLEVQTKLLRVLQEKTIERVGSSESLKVDVRIIAATHQNLEELIRRGRFREDLFYRLNVFPIRVPSLRERAEDIPELAMFFIQQSAQRSKKNVVQIEDDALSLLKAFPWPGNIRQLENVIERAVVITEVDTLTAQDMPSELFHTQPDWIVTKELGAVHAVEPMLASSFRSERDRFERDRIQRALAAAAGNKAEAARMLGIARTTLTSRMKKLGLE
jgi:transcriptional regulator with GAF, ATPase, and Fis domain